MIEAAHQALALAVGAVLGAFFFGGLWWTLRRVATSTRPARLVLVSLALRSSAVLAGVFLVSDAHWQRMALCVAGFAVARAAVLRRARAAVDWPSVRGRSA
jgi:F1F0 ATPase subunit 2